MNFFLGSMLNIERMKFNKRKKKIMKKLLLTLSICGLFLTSTSAFAQNKKEETKQERKEARKEKRLEKQAKEEQQNIMSIETLNFTFTPETVSPEFGMERDITSLAPYVTVDKDYFTAELPYLGTFYIQPVSPSEIPIQVYSSKFLYFVHTTDGITFTVEVVPTDTVNILNQGIKFDFTLNKNDGSATLVVSAENRDSITYTGYFNNN